jgi:hypothetical protein
VIWLPESATDEPELLTPETELVLPDEQLPQKLEFEESGEGKARTPRHDRDHQKTRSAILLQHVYRDHGDNFLPTVPSPRRRRLGRVAVCRTSVLGGHLQVCQKCGDAVPAYNSCRDRHCPTCQALDQERWLEARLARGLPVRYFHVVLTLPGDLRPFVFDNPALLYGDLLSVAANVVLALASDVLGGARSGLVALLHTWNSVLLFHPHVHLLVLGGGLDDRGEWVSPKGECLLPVDELRDRFKERFLSVVRSRLESGELVRTDGLSSVLDKAAQPGCYWHAYAKRTLRGADEAFSYLARYASRVALSNSRLLEYDGQNVRLAVKRREPIWLPAPELLWRHSLHVLPDRFFRIRHYGILSARPAKKALPLARASLERQGVVSTTPTVAPSAGEGWQELFLRKTGVDLKVCGRCEGPVARLPFSGEAGERALRQRLAELGRIAPRGP